MLPLSFGIRRIATHYKWAEFMAWLWHDVMTILYAILSCTSVYRCLQFGLQRVPVASVKNVVAAWLDDWYLVNKFAEMSIKLLFVFDGHELGLREPEGNKDVGRR